MENNISDTFLKTSKSFCVLPWIHMHIWADGKVFPCCTSDYRFPITNYHEHSSISEIATHSNFEEIRKNMLSNKECRECRKCYELEKNEASSMRIDSNKMYSSEVNKILNSNNNKTINFKMKFLDIRFSNLCNLSCVTCSPIFSSKLYKIHKAMDEHVPESETLNLDIYDKLEPYLLDVTNVNFAGGEPFINNDHYKILQYWLDNKMHDININYTSNLTVLKNNKFNLLNFWKEFKNISILASIDDHGPNISKIRKGADWAVIEENIRLIQNNTPHVKIKISPTVGALNLSRLFHMVKEMHLNFGIEPADWQVNILQYPEFFSIKSLTKKVKEDFLLEYLEYKKWLSESKFNDNGNFNSLVNFTKSNMEFNEKLNDERNLFLNKFNSVLINT